MAILSLALLLSIGSPQASDANLPNWAAPTEVPGLAAPDAPKVARLPPTPGGGAPPAQVPVDGGLSLLALAGAGYAARRLRARQ